MPRLLSYLIIPLLALASCERESPDVPGNPGDPVAEPEQGGAAGAKAAPEKPLPDEISFNEHIQPVLSEYCYACHGPDSSSRKPKAAPLRIDREQFAFEMRENLGRPVIVKGNPGASELLRRITTGDADELMPPPDIHKSMSRREAALIEKWIADGAEYEDHWSFLPPQRADFPDLPPELEAWVQNPIDRFTAARMADEGLSPNPPEDPARLFRRLSFDLTGLPPAPEEVKRFEEAADGDLQAAMEEAATRLLDTDASAEHFTRQWLDAARYADTHGIHIDNYRDIWPYRDWVLRAFRENMPFDRFTIEQVAGDLLENPSLDQVVATGFNRCLPTTGEGGAIAEEYDAIYAKDRVDTTAAVWLGLTTGCASCHDHKYDPLTMKDFYSFAAFFRNTTMHAMDGNRANHPPTVFVPLMKDRARWKELEAEVAGAEKRRTERAKKARPDFRKWLRQSAPSDFEPIDSSLVFHLPLTEAKGPFQGTVRGTARTWEADFKRRNGILGKAPLIGGADLVLGDVGNFTRTGKFSYGGFLYIEGKPTGAVIAKIDTANKLRGWDLWLEKGKVGAHVIDQWDADANRLFTNRPLEEKSWHHVMVTFDGTVGSHQALSIYIDGEKTGAKTDPNTLGQTITNDVPLRLGRREPPDNGPSHLRGTVALQDFRIYDRLLGADEIADLARAAAVQSYLATAADERTDEQEKAIYDYYLATADEPTREILGQLSILRSEQATLRARGSLSLIMEEKDEEAHAHIFTRGEYTRKGERVTADVPAALHDLTAEAPRNRLGLARWLVSRDNPLTARVTVNRTWYHLFGRGIVETTEDFGIMGARPTHPQLLDWLAVEFMESGWDHRHLVKLIVTSATYQQTAAAPLRKREADPENLFLARGPRYRLEAEQIRDLALRASGLLVEKTGGPSVKPYQPEGVWAAVAMPQSNTRLYKADTGEALYRRSLYTFWKRTAPHPAMDLLNAPSREVFCVRRSRTNTPLQAFVLMNDIQFVEAARQLAAMAMRSAGSVQGRLDFITDRLLSRTFREEEIDLVWATLDKHLLTYAADPAAAAELLSVGESTPDGSLPSHEMAAWTLVASQIMNLDEALTK